jgi:hypothetical protein
MFADCDFLDDDALLRNLAEALVKGTEVFLDFLAVEADGPAIRVDGQDQCVEKWALPGSVWADENHVLPRFHRKGEVMERFCFDFALAGLAEVLDFDAGQIEISDLKLIRARIRRRHFLNEKSPLQPSGA